MFVLLTWILGEATALLRAEGAFCNHRHLQMPVEETIDKLVVDLGDPQCRGLAGPRRNHNAPFNGEILFVWLACMMVKSCKNGFSPVHLQAEDGSVTGEG